MDNRNISIVEETNDINSTIIDNTKIILNETQDTRTVTMLNLKNGKTDKLIYYKKDNKMYSSITNKYIDLDSANLDYESNNIYAITTYSKKSSNKTYYFSYYTLSNAVGKSATEAGIVSFVIGSVGAVFPPADIAAGILGAYSAGASAALLNTSKSKNHRLCITVNPNPFRHIVGFGRY
ncbi:hypothetical protein [Anaerococcus sp.]|uniref:hypothetical protein n=1 Tax=Anaerococcus sp. TaxID=1872515 RepID=UPI00290181D0|nr:hypothetical protein [Anaerococcus sp.]MDU2599820.1 hypothetical protein [Anaerococcus sp.]